MDERGWKIYQFHEEDGRTPNKALIQGKKQMNEKEAMKERIKGFEAQK